MFTRRISWGAGHFQVIARAAFALVSLTLAFSITTLAQNGQNHGDSALAAKVRALNNQLLQLHAQFQQGLSGNGAAAARTQAATVIATRASALQSLIQQDPRAALSFAFSPKLLADLAAKFPTSASLLETQGTWRGTVEIWVTDYVKPAHSKTTVSLKTGQQHFELHFATGLLANLKSGDVVEATGVVLGRDLVVERNIILQSSSQIMPSLGAERFPGLPSLIFALLTLGIVFGLFYPAGLFSGLRKPALGFIKNSAIYVTAIALVLSPTMASAQTCSTTGEQNVAVLLVTFPGFTPPAGADAQSMNNLFFGTAPPSLDGYWREVSYGQTGATGNVYGWFTLSGSYSCSNTSQFVSDSLTAAANAGVNLQAYTRVFVVFPGMSPSCGWAGLSSIGCYSVTTSVGTYWLSASVLVWNYVTDPAQGVSLMAHEGGHQLGLAHARLRTFTDSNGNAIPLGPLGTTGTLYEYGDNFSTMGPQNLGHYAVGHKADVLNWLGSGTNFQVVQSSGTYTLQPYENSPAGLDALKVQRGTGNNAWLWIEYRQPIGSYDSTLPTQPFGGALIHYEDSITSPQTDLLDFTAPNTYSYNPALTAGQTWTDPYTNLSLSILGATSAGLTVSVNYGAVPCTSSAPTVNLSPLNPSIYPGQSASYSVSVTDNDSSGCAASTIDLASSQPSGWTTSFSSSSLTLSPGQSASLTMTKGAPSGTPTGTYAVDLSASNPSSSGSGAANATVVTPPTLTVSLSISGTSFLTPGSVPITALVTNGGVPVSGANTTFTVTTPSGGTATQTSTAGSNGIASWNYKLNSKSAVGTYSVVAQAALSSGGSGGKKTNSSTSTNTQTASSNIVSFSVQ